MIIWLIIAIVILFFLISLMIRLHGFVFKTITSLLSLIIIIMIVFGGFVFYDTNNFINEFKESDSLFIVFDENKQEPVIGGFILESEQGIMLDEKEIDEINLNFEKYKLNYSNKKELNIEDEIKEVFSDYVKEKLIELKKQIIKQIENKTKMVVEDQIINKSITNEKFNYIVVFNIEDMQKNEEYFIEEYSFDEFFDGEHKLEYKILLDILETEDSLKEFSNQIGEIQTAQLTDQKIRSFVFSQIVTQNQQANQLFLFEQSGVTMYIAPEKLIFKLMRNSLIKKTFKSIAQLIV